MGYVDDAVLGIIGRLLRVNSLHGRGGGGRGLECDTLHCVAGTVLMQEGGSVKGISYNDEYEGVVRKHKENVRTSHWW